MGRPLRHDAPGCWHHVMNRGAGRRIVFRDDGEHGLFVELLAELEDRFQVEVHAYCLMGNHYHAVLRSAEGRLSEAMAWIGSRFTRAVNNRRAVDDPIFRGRFHSVRIERDAHLDLLYGYVNANPVDLGWRGRLAEYPWSGHGVLSGRRSDQPWLRTEYYWSRFGKETQRIAAFVQSVGSRDPAGPVDLSDLRVPDVADAVAITRGAGPDVNSDADVRAAVTVVGLRAGLEQEALVGELSDQSARADVRRAERAVSTQASVAALVQRTESILTYCASIQPSGV